MANYEDWNAELKFRALENSLEQDIIVIDNVRSVPVMHTEYHTHYYYIGMCKSGRTLGQYNYRDTDFKAGDICWIMPDHVLSHNYVSDDYCVLSVFISKRLYQRFQERGALGKFHYPLKAVIIHLSDEQFQLMADGFRMMGRLGAIDHPQRDELLNIMCHVQAMLGDEFIRQQHPEFPQRQLPNEELFEHFYELIVRYHRESHEVAFYARLLCLTPKYFATVIKQTTGMAASEWINRYLMVEARWHLRTQKSIQQIALYLGFSEQASFSRFFKNYEGMSPTEYRNHI